MWARYGELLNGTHARVVADVVGTAISPRMSIRGIQAV
jgi:hypothetical protein